MLRCGVDVDFAPLADLYPDDATAFLAPAYPRGAAGPSLLLRGAPEPPAPPPPASPVSMGLPGGAGGPPPSPLSGAASGLAAAQARMTALMEALEGVNRRIGTVGAECSSREAYHRQLNSLLMQQVAAMHRAEMERNAEGVVAAQHQIGMLQHSLAAATAELQRGAAASSALHAQRAGIVEEAQRVLAIGGQYQASMDAEARAGAAAEAERQAAAAAAHYAAAAQAEAHARAAAAQQQAQAQQQAAAAAQAQAAARAAAAARAESARVRAAAETGAWALEAHHDAVLQVPAVRARVLCSCVCVCLCMCARARVFVCVLFSQSAFLVLGGGCCVVACERVLRARVLCRVA
jgi:hypothetical protein